jgi:murein L,D-transpeptidase YcbB/YkuD
MPFADDGGEAGYRVSGLANARSRDGVDQSQTRASQTMRRWAIGALLCTLAAALIVYAGVHWAMTEMGPPPFARVTHLMPTAAHMSDAVEPQEPRRSPLDPDKVDPRYLRMLFAFEDRRFYSHYGVDPYGLLRAARDLVLNGRIVTGGSTLTMQVARLLDNQYRRTPTVKLRQIVRAIQLERALTKKQILRLYLGLAPFGGRIKGVRAASLKFFGKEPHQLSVGEAALLVALPQAPEARRPDRDAEAALRARNFVLKTVAAAGVLTPAEAELASREPLIAEAPPMPEIPTPKPAVTHVAGLFAGLTLGLNVIVATPATAAPMQPPQSPPNYFLGSEEQVALDVRRRLLSPLPAGTEQADRDALWMFYAGRDAPVWAGMTGWTPAARAVIDEIKRADDWGLDAAAFDIPDLPAAGGIPLPVQQLADAEIGLSLAVMKYARYARGGRIEDPATQLSSYLDRKPQIRPPFLVMTGIAAAETPDDYLRKLHPQHEQFEKLRQEYLARRDGAASETVTIPKGSKIKPGATHEHVALIRERLGVAASGEDANHYDDALVDAVKRFQAKHNISPANGLINASTRRALNERQNVNLATLLANMEQWRWMPEDLGDVHVWVNVPEFRVRVVKDGAAVLDERVITGETSTQTPIFSKDLETIYFHPRWNIPPSIKVKEVFPSLARGGGYFYRQGLKVARNGKEVRPNSVNWYKADIRTYDIYQPSGPGNALGLMKFTFPNKHSVYMHDTQNKGLFDATQRSFSHGCVRVKNPLALAQLLLGIDKGWTPEHVAQLVKGDPEEIAVPLDKHIPVHLAYFTAQVDSDGEVTTEPDIYGHEKRITQALQGKWKDIDKGPDHLSQVELAQRLDDAQQVRKGRSGGSRRVVSRSYGGGDGGGYSARVSSGSTANDVFRRSFGF